MSAIIAPPNPGHEENLVAAFPSSCAYVSRSRRRDQTGRLRDKMGFSPAANLFGIRRTAKGDDVRVASRIQRSWEGFDGGSAALRIAGAGPPRGPSCARGDRAACRLSYRLAAVFKTSYLT